MALRLLVVLPLLMIGAGLYLEFGTAWALLGVGALAWADLNLSRRRSAP